MNFLKRVKEAFFKDDTGELNLLTVMITVLMLMFTYIFIKAEILEKAISETITNSIVQLISIAFGGFTFIGSARAGIDYVNRKRAGQTLVPDQPEIKPVEQNFTKNFTLSEFACNDGTPVPKEYIPNAQELATNLQVLRDHYNKPIVITSAYRHPEYNKSVGGKENSQHLFAKAADIRIEGVSPVDLAEQIETFIAQGKMKQGGIGVYTSQNFVHYDIRGTRARWGS